MSDCASTRDEASTELLIVEGDSAADATLAVRNAQWQAVLPVQGKPMNADHASLDRVVNNAQLGAIAAAIGAGIGDDFALDGRRYERVVLLLDPDADGIHARTLLLLFFDRWMHDLVAGGHLFMALPPLFTVRSERLAEPLFAWTDRQLDKLRGDLDAQGVSHPTVERHRGVASLSPALLHERCLDPTTRTLSPMTTAHAEAARRAFAGIRPGANEGPEHDR